MSEVDSPLNLILNLPEVSTQGRYAPSLIGRFDAEDSDHWFSYVLLLLVCCSRPNSFIPNFIGSIQQFLTNILPFYTSCLSLNVQVEDAGSIAEAVGLNRTTFTVFVVETKTEATRSPSVVVPGAHST